MRDEEKIVKYVIDMLKKDEVDLLLGRMEVLADLLHGLEVWEIPKVIAVICKMPEEGGGNGEL